MQKTKPLGDCPKEGVCTCRAQNLKRRKNTCRKLAVHWCNGEKRAQPQSQKGMP